jgi:hypothetical protein
MARSENLLREKRERFNSLMEAWGDRAGWRLPEKLPDLPKDEIPPPNVSKRSPSPTATIWPRHARSLKWRPVPWVSLANGAGFSGST